MARGSVPSLSVLLLLAFFAGELHFTTQTERFLRYNERRPLGSSSSMPAKS
jgi:hypothetical protein